jgi:hypothetical protein
LTVTGTFRDATGELRAGVLVKFLPESNPQPDATGVLTAIVVSVETDEEGEISIELEQGTYLVNVATNPRDKFRITVPDSDDTADITTLMEAEEFEAPGITQVGNNFRIKSGYLQLKNIDTGLWHTFRLVGPAGMEQTDIQIPGEA